MQGLLQYPGVVFDANCIVYFCFKFTTKDTSERSVEVLGPETYRARTITDRLIEKQKLVSTVRKAWDEAQKVLVGKALENLIREGFIQQKLRIVGAISPSLRLRMAQALNEEVKSLSGKAWFRIDKAFVPPKERVAAVEELYARFCANSEYHDRIPAYKGRPSETDIVLILYSDHTRWPLITNDREISNFATELKDEGFCRLIRAFHEIKLN